MELSLFKIISTMKDDVVLGNLHFYIAWMLLWSESFQFTFWENNAAFVCVP